MVNDFAAQIAGLQHLTSGLIGERVIVRTWRPEDAPALYAAIDESRDHLARWMPWVHHHQGETDTADYVARYAEINAQGDIALGIFSAEDGRTVLGATGFHDIDWTIPALEIGYWASIRAEGNGYITEAIRLLTEFAIAELSANRMVICCDPGNARSRRVAERVGYVLEGQLRNAGRAPDGSLRDTLVFSRIPESAH
ncbi:MAG TPA: GNAT family N-acetyltransferase [Thermomicrobiales bacterium]|nr:GNAT family N-acetyltransferase [Thermomicrobiales bacterium]